MPRLIRQRVLLARGKAGPGSTCREAVLTFHTCEIESAAAATDSAGGAGAGNRRAGPRLWPLLSILLLSTAVDALFFTGYGGMDALEYTSGAHHVLFEGRLPARVSLGQERMVLVGWNVLIGWLIGWDPQLIAGSYIFFHQALTLCTFLFARRWFDWRVGLLAAWCVALYPEVVIHSTIMIPDIPLALFVLLAVGAFMTGRELRAAGRGGRGLVCYLLAGLCVGLAYMTKSTALLVLPFLLLLWLWGERGRPGLMALGAGFAFVLGILGVFVLEWALFRVFTGHTYFRLSWLLAGPVPGEQLISRYGTDPLERLSRFLSRVDGFRGPHDLGVLFIVGVVLYPLVVRRRWAVVLLPVWWFAYLTWGSMSFSRYFPGPIHLRYYIPALPFLGIVLGAVAVRLWGLIEPRVRPVHARRGLPVVLIALAVAIPLRHLRTPNRLAGKFYRTPAITGALDAMRFAAQAGYEPLVMSGPLYQQVSGLYLNRAPEGFTPSTDIPNQRIDQLLDEGFYYVACPQAMFGENAERSRRSILDDVLHPAIKENPYPNTRTEGRWAVRVYTGADGCRQVFVGGRRLVVREISRFGPLRDRLTECMALIAPDPRGRAPAEGYRQAGLYHVLTRPAEFGGPQR